MKRVLFIVILMLCYCLLQLYHQQGHLGCTENQTNTVQENNASFPSVLNLKELYSLNLSTDGNGIYLVTALDTNIKARALCAAESWSLHHPSRKVWFGLTTEVAEDSDNLLRKLLENYRNLAFVYLNLTILFNNTPFQDIISSGRWRTNTAFPEVNLSDLTRLAIVSHTGGLYTDTDVVAIKNTDHLRNFVGIQHQNELASGIFHFDRTSKYLKALMELIAKYFQPNYWSWNGPIAMTATGKKLCGKNFMKSFTNGTYPKCYGVSFLPRKTFYPIFYTEHRKYMMSGLGKRVNELFKETYAIHIWNKLSKDVTTKFGSQSIYDVVARSNCPVVYTSMKMRSDHF